MYDSEDDLEPPIYKSYNSTFILEPPILYLNDPNYKYKQHCKVTVKIDEKIYTTDVSCPHYYYINYSYEYIENNDKCVKISKPYRMPSNPFYKSNNAEEECHGTIIYKNSMTEEMVKFLLMSIEELSNYSATRCPYYYKIQIFRSIANFW